MSGERSLGVTQSLLSTRISFSPEDFLNANTWHLCMRQHDEDGKEGWNSNNFDKVHCLATATICRLDLLI
jgi:hypothetical protein